jgi:hypothetical protein
MVIFLDESGTFGQAPDANSFCVVAGYVIPERLHGQMEDSLRRFKAATGHGEGAEVKRRDVKEEDYFRFLAELSDVGGVAFALATDASLNDAALSFRDIQAQKVADNEPRMNYPEGRALVLKLAADIRALSPQNFVELMCRTQLAANIINGAQLYFVQRDPETLSRFQWRFDRKDLVLTHFEATFKHLSSALLQTMSLEQPLMMLEGADYSHFDAAFSLDGGYPDWLPVPPNPRDRDQATSAAKIWATDHAYVDSATSPGVQVADLIVSGLHGCLRGRFADNDLAAALLGRLMVQSPAGKPVVPVIALTNADAGALSPEVARRIHLMRSNARPMSARPPRA